MQRPRLSGDRVDSRWWYWIVAAPAVFAFWVVTVAWVALAIWVESDIAVWAPGNDPVTQSASISLTVFGVPLVVLVAILPLAVFQDTRAIDCASVEWSPPGSIYALLSLCSWLVGVAMRLLFVYLSIAIIAGSATSVVVALYYLWQRHEHVGVP